MEIENIKNEILSVVFCCKTIQAQRKFDKWKDKGYFDRDQEYASAVSSWASLIEARMIDNITLDDIAQQALDDMCLYMGYKVISNWHIKRMVDDLAEIWEHGNSLKDWYDKEFL